MVCGGSSPNSKRQEKGTTHDFVLLWVTLKSIMFSHRLIVLTKA